MDSKKRTYTTYGHNVLARDNTIVRLESQGGSVRYRRLSAPELRQALLKKLHEEAAEVIAASSRTELCSELADLLTVIDAISAAHEISATEIAKIKQEKAVTRGGFDRGIFIIDATLPDDAPLSAYAKSSPEKYPVLGHPAVCPATKETASDADAG